MKFFAHMKIYLLVFVLFLANNAIAHGMSESEKQTIIDGGNFEYISIGMTHMLSGYDHLLFVFGIVFFLTTFKDIVKYITAFTLGHSITLIFATFNSITINYFLIDAIIGLSVCYIAFVNLDGFKKYLNIKAPNMLFMITSFGLIHGFGLSTRLQELPLSENSLLMNIISFNIGIEVGQIIALSVMLFIISLFRKSSKFIPFSLGVNYSLILAGVFFFASQISDYSNSINTKELLVKKEENWKDTIKVTIPAHGEIEYKFWIEKDKLLEYTWSSDNSKLYFDFHGEPAGDTTGYFKSYKESTLDKSNGSLIAPFLGTHGWYWKNESSKNVVVTLKVKGEYKRFDK